MRTISEKIAIQMNEKRWNEYNFNFSKLYNWDEIQNRHDSGETIGSLRKRLNISYSTMKKAMELGLIIKKHSIRPKVAEETKMIISQKRKEWLRKNPDKHPWRNKDKFKSKPCEKVKEFLNSSNIQFVEEYVPSIDGRSFSIDIALPDKMIAIEINGNQHYEKDGTLKPYYQERHDLLEANGWIVYEIHYSACFSFDKWNDFRNVLVSSDKKIDFDYFKYTPKEKVDKKCLDCGCDIKKYSTRCKSCNIKHRELEKNKNVRKFLSPDGEIIEDKPNKEKLESLVLKYPLTKLGEMFGVSDNSIRKWCQKMDIKCPDNKYRMKMLHSKQENGED